MLGVPRELIDHELHLDPKAKKDVIKREIARLLDVVSLRKCTA
jgi:hypothetical protein